MDKTDQILGDRIFINRAMEAAIRIGIVALLVLWCLLIVKPFIAPVLWGGIIAIGVFPLYRKLAMALGNRDTLAAAVLTLAAIFFLVFPSILLTDSAVGGIQALSKNLEQGTLHLPPPPEGVASWPFVGKPVHEIWNLASVNIDAAIQKIEPQLKEYGPKVLTTIVSLGLTIIQLVISIIIAGIMLVKAKSGQRVVRAVFIRLAGERGKVFTDLAGATVRSVVQGVLGVAIIQSVLAGLGLMVAGVPIAGLWALVVLFLAVVQLPPILILGPIIFYVFSTATTTTAGLFMIWSILVSMSDTFLKPLFLGRGVDVPMLVVLLGAIGGMMASGIIGLFVGSVVLSIGYKLFQAWLYAGSQNPEGISLE